MTANGWVDLGRDLLALQGTVAPAYLLNSILASCRSSASAARRVAGGPVRGGLPTDRREHRPGDRGQPAQRAGAVGVLRQLFAPIVGLPAIKPEQQAEH